MRMWRMRHLKRLSDPFVLGVTTAALYLGVISHKTMTVSVSANWVEENKLNNLGNFLAGAFAPVAFLWLIVLCSYKARASRNT